MSWTEGINGLWYTHLLNNRILDNSALQFSFGNVRDVNKSVYLDQSIPTIFCNKLILDSLHWYIIIMTSIATTKIRKDGNDKLSY